MSSPDPVVIWVWQLCGSCLRGSCGSCSARTTFGQPCLCRHAYRVLVTGSRTWDLAEAVYRQLDRIEAKAWRLGYRCVTVVQGGARGPDRYGIEWTQRPSPWQASGCGDRPVTRVHETHRPVWKPCGGYYDPRAAHKRNVRMAELGAREYVAFADTCAKDSCPQRGQHWSHGTADQVEICEAAGIPGMPHDRLEAQVMLEFGGGNGR